MDIYVKSAVIHVTATNDQEVKMKKTATKSLRSVLALLLALCLTASLCGAAFADSGADAADANAKLGKAADSVEAFADALAAVEDYVSDADAIINYAENGDYSDEAKATIKNLLKIAEDELSYTDYLPESMQKTADELKDVLASVKSGVLDPSLRSELLAELKDLREKLVARYGEDPEGKLDADIDKAVGVIDNAIDTINVINARVAKLTSDVEIINAKLDNVNTALVDLNDNVKSVVDILREMKKDADSASDANYEELVRIGKQYARAAWDVNYLYGAIDKSADEAAGLLSDIADGIQSVIDEVQGVYDSYSETYSAIDDLLYPFVDVVIEDLQDIANSDSVKNAGDRAAKAEELRKQYNDYATAILDAADLAAKEIADAATEREADIRAEINALYDELSAKEDFSQELKDQHDELVGKQSELRGKLEELRDALKDAADDTRDAILAEIDVVNDALKASEDLYVQLEEADANTAELIQTLRDKISAAEDEYDRVKAEADEKIAKVIGDANSEVDALNVELEGILKKLANGLLDTLDDIEKDRDDASAIYNSGIDDAIAALKALNRKNVAATLNKLSAIIKDTKDRLYGYSDKVKSYAKDIYNKVKAAFVECKKTVLERYQFIDEGLYKVASSVDDKDKNYYVAFGDYDYKSSKVAGTLAGLIDKYNADYALADNYDDFGVEGMGISELLAELKDASSESAKAVADADLVTLSFNPLTYVTTRDFDLKSSADYIDGGLLDWDSCLRSKDAADYVKLALRTFEKALKEDVKEEIAERRSVPADYDTYAHWLVNLAAAYTYSYAEILMQYPAVIDEIHSINPDALCVIVSSPDSFEDFELTYGSRTIPVGTMFDQVCDFMDAYFITYTMNQLDVDDFTDYENWKDYMPSVTRGETTTSSFEKDGVKYSEISQAAYDELFAAIKTVFVRVPNAETKLEASGVPDLGNLKGLSGDEYKDLALDVFELLRSKDSVTLTDAGQQTVANAIYDALVLNKVEEVKDTPQESEKPTTPPEESEKPTEQPTASPSASPNGNPKTGDETNIAVWAIVLVVCGAATVAILPRKKTDK